MGIYIKGIKIPPTCRYCAFRHLSISENAFCTAAHETIDYMAERTKRLDNCPLVELPPHGDLIDRDSVLEILSDKNAAWDGYAKVKALPIVVESEE